MDDKYLLLKKNGWQVKLRSFVTGGIEPEENVIKAASRELLEETGYKNIQDARILSHKYYVQFYHEQKKENRRALISTVFITLKDLEKVVVSDTEKQLNTPEWVNAKDVDNKLHGEGCRYVFNYRSGLFPTYSGEGITINSGKYSGLSSAVAREDIVSDLVTKKTGKERINYKIRDWLISRQRYWGAPIPIIHCPKCGTVPVPEKDLPVVLPPIKSYEPSGDGRSPLANVPEFVNTTCPACGGKAERETDTMDGFACSSWYFLRFADPHNNKEAFTKTKADFWLPVDDYIGGAEHAVMHLLYARFWTKVMYDEGLINFQEPFTTLRNQGMILAPDGQKMSKSKGNTIEPDGLIEQGYGADSTRIMELFIGPWDQSAAWSVEGMGGSFRFLQRAWTLAHEYMETKESGDQKHLEAIRALRHRTIAKVSSDLEDLSFNTAIAALMEYVNNLYKYKAEDNFGARDEWSLAIENLVQLLAPFAPHIAEELWQELGHKDSVHTSSWPVHGPKYLISETVTIVVQINGKVRANLKLSADSNQEQVTSAAQADSNVVKYTKDKKIKKTIYVPGKLINFVVG